MTPARFVPDLSPRSPRAFSFQELFMRKHPSRRPAAAARDVHADITAKIVQAIEAGAGDFQMPWHRPGASFAIPQNALTGKPYRGSNILSLWIDADEKRFGRQIWATFKQYQELCCQVRKGERGSLIVKYGLWTPKDARSDADESGEDSPKRLYARAAWVFNVDQVDGYAGEAPAPRSDLTTRLAHVDAFIAATGIEFREGGSRAFYRRKNKATGEGGYVQMPPRNLFTGTATSTPTEAYESTRLHEAGHASGDEHRLNREFGKRFGDKAYAFEELVAELIAAYLCAELQIANAPRLDHAQYLSSWLEVLGGDKKAIFTAASLASQAVDYLKSFQKDACEAPQVSLAA
jgi:antirestriction protein ArdC